MTLRICMEKLRENQLNDSKQVGIHLLKFGETQLTNLDGAVP